MSKIMPPLSRRDLLLSLTATGLAGCLERPDTGDGNVLELLTFWTTAGEVQAIEELLAEVHKQAGVVVQTAQRMSNDEVQDEIATSIAARAPADIVHCNGGKGLMRWVLESGDVGQSRLVDLASEWIRHPEQSAGTQPELSNLVSTGNGTLWGLPLNINRNNSMFYNVRILEEEGLEPPTSLDELFLMLEALQSAGYTYPIGLGAAGPWTLGLLVMENLLPAVAARERGPEGGADFYRQFFAGRSQPNHPYVLEAFDLLRRLKPYVSASQPSESACGNVERGGGWQVGVDRLLERRTGCQDRSAMAVMGDWAKGRLLYEGLAPEDDFLQRSFPGTEGIFVFSMDVLAAPVGAVRHREERAAFFEAASSVEALDVFSRAKGALPARADMWSSLKDPSTLAVAKDFEAHERVSALSGILERYVEVGIQKALGATFDQDNPEPLLFALSNYYHTFGS